MKKILAFIATALISLTSMLCCARTDVPTTIQKFITTNFPTTKIVKVDREQKYGGIEYEIRLNNGAELDFDKNQKWEQIDCKKLRTGVPTNIIPKNISKYIAKNYSNQHVTKIERERYGYNVKLSNHLELEFNRAGNFVRIDD
jgi:hypothetical protein